ncbi:hypothetical protein [Nonomuraea cavernae]|uniref:hypothetical protein n=1 Tax=Nonomuraea cavernae TaxID=2045107 RepID=UPI0034080DA5
MSTHPPLRRTTVIVLALAGLLANVTPASAAAADSLGLSCGPNNGAGLNPYAYVPQNERVHVARRGYDGSTEVVNLYRSTHIEYNGARIWWVWGTGLSAGDKISLDWSDDGTNSWWACHGTVTAGHTTWSTRAVDKAGSRKFRACVKPYNRSWACTWGWHP